MSSWGEMISADPREKEVKKHMPPQRGAGDGRKGAGRDQHEATSGVRTSSSLELSQRPRKCCLLKSTFRESVEALWYPWHECGDAEDRGSQMLPLVI